jgi:CBS domain-containing protein
MEEAQLGGMRLHRIEEATIMTATLSPSISLDRLLGTVGEAMTGEVTALQADTPADIAIRRLEQAQVSGAPSSTMAGSWAW